MAEVEIEFDGPVAVVTINRPEAKNAINRAVAEGIAAAVDEIEKRKEISVAILTGAGNTFCAGMDLKAFLAGEPVRVEGRGFAGLCQAKLVKPMIAAVEGYALAGGFELTLACDLIVASEAAKFGLPEVKRGLVAGAGGLLRLPRQLPRRIATAMILTGDPVSAAYLEKYGLINSVTPVGGALAEAKRIAHVIASNGPLAIAIAIARQVLQESQDWTASDMFEKQGQLIAPIFKSQDAREGALAFAQKRAPVWSGK